MNKCIFNFIIQIKIYLISSAKFILSFLAGNFKLIIFEIEAFNKKKSLCYENQKGVGVKVRVACIGTEVKTYC